jgi:hypothetical protein
VASDLLKRAKSLVGLDRPVPGAAAPRRPIKPFHSVTIVPGPRACVAAHAQFDQRFLAREAPPLPLKGCECTHCECRYEHYDDRRNGDRRVHGLSVPLRGEGRVDHRAKSHRDRRKPG